ncbi:MAG: hypothetical protein M3Y41_21770 [Pseudomonadota bacterium]|nr:hypothetical protein [Pseudomonadota bacterium]
MNRRTILQSGALAAGSAATGGVWSGAARASVRTEAAGEPITGRLVACLSIASAGGATARVVELDAASQPVRDVAHREFAANSVTAAHAETDALALDAAARSWGVPAQACRIGPGQIALVDGSRAVSYVVWTEVA